MYFRHSNKIWNDFPELVPGVLHADGITKDVSVADCIARFNAIAEGRLADSSEGELPEIQAWRRTFSRMGLKPTQYRCASEALLRRFRKEKSLPQIHPLIDVCNAMSMAFAIPIAVFDTSKISQYLEVRHATGEEDYLTFSGQSEHPSIDEVIFADGADKAHARRWTNRQSALSAIRDETSSILVVAEAMHDSAPEDIEKLMAVIAKEFAAIWSSAVKTGVLGSLSPEFAF